MKNVQRKTAFAIILVITDFGTGAFARPPKSEVVFTSECSCQGDHGESRWHAKIDPTDPPALSTQVQQVSPSEMYAWQGPGVAITRKQDRIAPETRWLALTGRVVSVRAEEDGDLHLLLQDAAGAKPGSVVAEIPLESKWCALRTKVFSWTDATFPLETRRGANVNLRQQPVITVVGRALYDVDHAGKDTKNNRRSYDPTVAVWEVHPVMRLDVRDGDGQSVRAPAAKMVQPNAMAPSPPAVNFAPTPAARQFVTILIPTKISVPYGAVTLPRGMRLEVASRNGSLFNVRYADGTYPIPIANTDSTP